MTRHNRETNLLFDVPTFDTETTFIQGTVSRFRAGVYVLTNTAGQRVALTEDLMTQLCEYWLNALNDYAVEIAIQKKKNGGLV